MSTKGEMQAKQLSALAEVARAYILCDLAFWQRMRPEQKREWGTFLRDQAQQLESIPVSPLTAFVAGVELGMMLELDDGNLEFTEDAHHFYTTQGRPKLKKLPKDMGVSPECTHL